jgi:hypothetical protein
MGVPSHCYTCAGGAKFWKMVGKALRHQLASCCHGLWMGVWVYPYTVTPVQVGPNFETLGVWRSNKQQCDSCFEAVNHPTLYLTSILNTYSVWAFSYDVDGHMGAPLYMVTPVQVGAKFWKIGCKGEPK